MELNGLSELHVHLDGSMRPETLFELLGKRPQGNPYASIAEMEDTLCFRKGMDLPSCLNSFSTSLSVMQTVENIERFTCELVQDHSADGVAYLEFRYCPELHTTGGLDLGTVVRAACQGAKEGARLSKEPIVVRQIITILRDLGEEHGWRMVKLAEENINYGVVGIDLAGNEYDHPPQEYANIYRYAKTVGLHRSVHAGEVLNADDPAVNQRFRAMGIDNVRTAITALQAERIGHGIAMQYDPLLMDLAREKSVVIEVCPTSNIHTGSISEYREHPASIFVDAGITIVPCADNTLFSKTTTSQEYLSLSPFFSTQELHEIARKARTVRFL